MTPAEGGALALIERVLKGAGFKVNRMTFAEPGTDPIENLYARIGTAAPHLMLAGHTDVVPPGDETKWTHPPFAAEIADGVLYGRGAVDMKGAIACKLAAALDYVAAAGGKPKGSLSFLITGDEEGIAVNGTIKLLEWLADHGEKFDHAILGEPTNPEKLGDMIKIGRRGSQNGTLIVTGTQGHVAYPELADNPVRGIATLMGAVNAEPLDGGTRAFRGVESRIHLDRRRQQDRQSDSRPKRARASTSASMTRARARSCGRKWNAASPRRRRTASAGASTGSRPIRTCSSPPPGRSSR